MLRWCTDWVLAESRTRASPGRWVRQAGRLPRHVLLLLTDAPTSPPLPLQPFPGTLPSPIVPPGAGLAAPGSSVPLMAAAAASAASAAVPAAAAAPAAPPAAAVPAAAEPGHAA